MVRFWGESGVNRPREGKGTGHHLGLFLTRSARLHGPEAGSFSAACTIGI